MRKVDKKKSEKDPFSTEVVEDFVKGRKKEMGVGHFAGDKVAAEFANELSQNQVNRFWRYGKVPKAYLDFINFQILVSKQLSSLDLSKTVTTGHVKANINHIERVFHQMLTSGNRQHGEKR